MPPAAPARSLNKSAACVTCPSALERIEIFGFDAAALAEQHHQNRETDGRFRRRHGQYEEHENLAAEVAEETRERDKIEVDRQQHELDAHQEHDDVPAIQENTGDAD